MFFELKVTLNNDFRLRRLEKSELPWEQFFIAVGELPADLSAYRAPMISAAN